MKILLLTAHYSPNVGGVETHLDDLTQSLTQRGNKIFVLTYRPLTTKTSWKIFENRDDLKIFRIPWVPGLFYKLIHKPVLTFVYLFPGLFIVLPFCLLINKPEVIHAHGIVAGSVAVFWGKIINIRTVVSTHSIYSFPKSGIYRKFVVWIFNNASHVSTLSKQGLKEIQSLGINKSNTSNFTYWVDMGKFKNIPNAKKFTSWGNNFTVLFVGRLVEEKGVRELLGSFDMWNKNINLAIAGDGPMVNRVKKISKVNRRLIYLGRVSQEKLPIYYSASDLLIVPSISEEGFGRVIIESLACGTPVIGSKKGAIPEAINNSVGTLIDVNCDTLKDTVEKYYKNRKLVKIQSESARNFAVQKYSENNVVKIINSYKQ